MGRVPAPPDIPETFGRYRILEVIGRGGMGIVYRAHDPKLERDVALKVLVAGEGASREQVKRFFQEATSAARLRHPNIVPIHELDVHEGTHYFTMELVEGRPLSKLIGNRDLTPRRAAEILMDVARAVHHAHGHGIIHRDIKPSNIIVTPEGRPMVTDFGLAKQVHSEKKLTQAGRLVGTPSYMAPEQALLRQDKIDARTDVWALGAVLYEMLTGLPPFVGASSLEILERAARLDPVPPRECNPACPRDVEVMCLKCLEKDPEGRYRTAEELSEDCRRFLAGEPISARPATPWYRAERTLARHKVAAAVAALALVVIAGLVVRYETSPPSAPLRPGARAHVEPIPAEPQADAPPPEPVAVLEEDAETETPQQLLPPPDASGWPVVFDNPLTHRAAYEYLHLSMGQYCGYARLSPGTGMRVSGIHTDSAVWVDVPLGEEYGAAFEFGLDEAQKALWWLAGPGYGNSPGLGYCLSFDGRHAVLLRKGAQVRSAEYPGEPDPAHWYATEVVRSGGRFAVRVDGTLLISYEDEDYLRGVLHSRFGFGAHRGHWDSGVRYRNLRVRALGGGAEHADVPLSPPPTDPPRENVRMLYEMRLTEDGLREEWPCSQPGNARLEDGALFLGGLNAAPRMTLQRAVEGDFACEVEMEYPGDEALNFSISVLYGGEAPPAGNDRAGWIIALPHGAGVNQIDWLSAERGRRTLAGTPYYVPTRGRNYLVRAECAGKGIRLFLDGGFLMEADRPPEEEVGPRAYVGMAQLYAGVRVHAVRLYALEPGARLLDASPPEKLKDDSFEKSPSRRKRPLRSPGRGRLRDPESLKGGSYERIKDGDANVRIRAVQEIGKAGGRTAVPILVEALRDASPSVRSTAALALGQIGEPSAVPALIEAMKDEWLVQFRAAEALGKLGDRSAVPSLIEALDHSRSVVRACAAEALGKLGDKSALPVLTEALRKEEPTARSYSASLALVKALGTLRGREAVPLVAENLKSDLWLLRRHSAEALGAIGDPAALAPLREALGREKDEHARREIRKAIEALEAVEAREEGRL